MKDIVRWLVLSDNNRPKAKMAALADNFEKRKTEANLESKQAKLYFYNLEKIKGIGAGIITYIDPDYPEEFKNLAYPPAYLFYKGNKELLKYPIKVTVVGSREATVYGLNVASELGMELAEDDVVVVSGGAKGIDSAALLGAMRAKGKVIAVMGTGIDKVYPKENKRLFDDIIKSGGLILSEFPVGMGPLAQNFPVRNRIMTALADSVVVVEAALNSGSLITASYACEMGKTLFSVPGNIDSPNSRGTNALIRDGALVALSASDVIFELMERESEKFRKAKNFVFDKKEEQIEEKQNIEEEKDCEENVEYIKLTPYERAVVKAMHEGCDTYETIMNFCAMEPKKLTSLLTIMEMKGIIKLAFGNRYKIVE